MSEFVGLAFEELEEQEMINIQGGGISFSTVTTWSSAPCLIGASIGSAVISVSALIIN